MQTVPHHLEVSPELEADLEKLRHAYRLPSTTAVLELLISTQINTTVHRMTGMRQGPRLAVDNTNTTTSNTTKG